ncbi:MAG: DPP IV N-terminal domain-containing protein [Bacteroidales bacterium]|nr:DPP IV N-terminal domain-containing protein [Bacteroidales bacterium]
MKKLIIMLSLCAVTMLSAQETNRIPRTWRWIGDHQVAFTHDFGRASDDDFVVDAATHKVLSGATVPAMPAMRPVGAQVPFKVEGAENLKYSPDSTKMAFTRDNDLWVIDVATRKETRLTSDGSDVILNGYASWVYYEEILGRASRYCAFWWSPDSKKIGFYRFDNTDVPFFPIYSPVAENADRSGLQLGYGQNAGGAVALEDMSPTGGSVRMTRYPKCGDANPKVRIGIVDLEKGSTAWADFNENDDQYFGTPFWGADSKAFFIQREPRIQNTLDLYAVSPADGSKTHIYHETYDTWLDWISGMVFGRDGLYMVRSFETGWEQVYYLSYDGKTLRRLTDGDNWRVAILSVKEGKPAKAFDGTTSEVLYSAQRDSHVRTGVYLATKGSVRTVSNPALSASQVSISPDKKYVVASQGNSTTPDQIWLFDLVKPSKSYKVADSAGPDFNPEDPALPRIITMITHDGLELPAMIAYPKDFDPSKKYPVHVDLYGGPDSPQVSDRFRGTSAYKWYSDNGIIEVVADCRASGYNGRKGLDMIYKHLDEIEVQDFVEWAEYLKKLPYVNGDKIGVEGFSFGGTMTALLVMKHPDAFHYGIAGGGVYEWALYDTHYTERFMSTPQDNPEGYERTKVTNAAKEYPVTDANYDGSVMLKLTHGTGDDNVHFQNTLKLVDALQKEGKKFELMIYPDGMHGYRGYQGRHFNAANRAFWLKYLKGE